ADRFGGIDPSRDWNKEARRADRILCVAANDTEIGDQLAFARRGHAGPSRLDDADKVIAWRERQWPFEVRISAATDESIGEAGAGGEHLDPDLARPRRRNGLLFRQFQDFGTAEPSDADVLPRHALTVAVIVTGVMPHVAGALTGSLLEFPFGSICGQPTILWPPPALKRRAGGGRGGSA